MCNEVIRNLVKLNGRYADLITLAAPYEFYDLKEPVKIEIEDVYRAIQTLSPSEIQEWCANMEAFEATEFSSYNEDKIYFLISELAPERYQF